MSEKGDKTFRNAEIDGGNVTLWVKNCLDYNEPARQLCVR
jgi:hypothetical protein